MIGGLQVNTAPDAGCAIEIDPRDFTPEPATAMAAIGDQSLPQHRHPLVVGVGTDRRL